MPPETCRFDTETSFALPQGFATDQLDALSKDRSALCSEGELSFSTRDMNGDRAPDLVVADRCDIAGVGTDHWLVYLSDAGGFSTPPIAWSLPSGYLTDQLDDVDEEDGGLCSVGLLRYATVDLDGDERPDLVVTDRCDVAGVGDTEWLVYFNQGDRFASTPHIWTLPMGFRTDQLDSISADGGGLCTYGELSYGLRDMNGDRRPDLVVTDDCDVAGVGTSHWLVFLNSGGRFAAQATIWTLPAGFLTDEFDDLEQREGGLCTYGELSYGLRDMDGDRRPELVVTDHCDVAGVGTEHWMVFTNLEDGFADSGIVWPLPRSEFRTDQLDDLYAEDSALCSEGRLSFGVVDSDGDEAMDLLVADHCDLARVGTTHWRVYRSTPGVGFAAAGAWTLPAGFHTDAFDTLQSNSTCAYGGWSFAAKDMNGDRVLDLVVADDCDLAEVGTTHWRVFWGRCD